jgi:DNA-binding winged helix-turn-helix (wHTH) protein
MMALIPASGERPGSSIRAFRGGVENRQARPFYQFGPFRLDRFEQMLLCNGRPLSLTPKAFEVLCVLVENAGHLVGKEQLLHDVWPDCFVEEGALSRYVSVLRKTLSEGDSSQQYIATVPKRGYRFVAPRHRGPL